VEDDAQVRAVTVRALRASGYEVLVAGSGGEALALAAADLDGLDLVVTDVVMPGLDGRTMADELQRRRPGLRVLYVSGYTEDAVVARGVASSGKGFLAKPFTPSALLESVRAVLDAAPPADRPRSHEPPNCSRCPLGSMAPGGAPTRPRPPTSLTPRPPFVTYSPHFAPGSAGLRSGPPLRPLFSFLGDRAVMTGVGESRWSRRAPSARPVLIRDGYDFVDVEWVRGGGRFTLRVYVDKPGGVNVDDCQLVSRTVEPILDVEDFIEPAYDLEVSSPGLDRPLRTAEHFGRYAGQRVRVKAYGPVAGTAPGSPARKNWTGVLVGYRDGAVEIDVDGVVHRVPHDQIAKAHLEYDFEADLRRKD
jgi:ribosome maturation factor RimP